MIVRIKKSRKSKSSRRHKGRLVRNAKQALSFERLESRQLLAAITVTNATDLINADTNSISALIASDGGDGVSLREAIEATNNTTGADTIDFDPSVFNGGLSSLIRLTQGELEITDSLNIDASTATDVTITGDASADDITLPGTFITDVAASGDMLGDNARVLNFSGTNGDLALTNLILTGGQTDDGVNLGGVSNTGDGGGGGGILFNSGGILSLTTSTVSGNSTGVGSDAVSSGPYGGVYDGIGGEGGNGGGIFISSGTVTLNNSTVSGNSTGAGGRGFGGPTGATGGDGGNGGGIFISSGTVTLNNSTVSDNSTEAGGGAYVGGNGGQGGGIYAAVGTVTLNNSAVNGNSTGAGGGGYDSSKYGSGGDGGGIFTSSVTVTLTNSTVSGNSTRGRACSFYAPGLADGDGGGVFASSGELTLTNSTVSGNSTGGCYSDGGGVYTISSDVNLTNSTVSGNSARQSGGGVFTSSGKVTLNNSTVSGNSTGGYYSGGGGGVYTISGVVNLTSSTIANNVATGTGGGILIGNSSSTPSLTIENSIIAGNIDNGTAPDLLPDPGSTLTINHSLIGDTNSSGITGTTGAGNILNQPSLLGPLADNGGPTLTHALLSGSPAIDAGDNGLAVDANGTVLTTDQRGEDRIKSGTVDIGAVEGVFLLGDADLSGVVNFADIPAFIDVLISGIFLNEADVDRSGAVDFADIPAFIDVLINVGSAQSSSALSNSVAPVIASGSVVTSQAILVESPVIAAASVVPVAEPESIASAASSVEVPIANETAFAPDPATDSLASPVAESSQLSTADVTIADEAPVDTDSGPVAFAPVDYSSLKARQSSLSRSQSDRPLVKRRSLAGNTERLDLPSESRDANPGANESIEKSYSTAAELFDAEPESLDEVFDFDFEETLAGLI